MLCERIILQIVIQIVPTFLNRILVYVIKPRTSKIKLGISILVITSAENDLLSQLKNMILTVLKIIKYIKYLKVLLKVVKVINSKFSGIDVEMI